MQYDRVPVQQKSRNILSLVRIWTADLSVGRPETLYQPLRTFDHESQSARPVIQKIAKETLHDDLFVLNLIQFAFITSFCNCWQGRSISTHNCVMHKCIMVKLGGERKTRKVCKKHVNFTKSGVTFKKVWGKYKFCRNRGNVLFSQWLKKGHQKNVSWSRKIFLKYGQIWTMHAGGNASLPRSEGMDGPDCSL